MSQGPAPRDPGQDENLSGGPAGPADFPELGSPRWRLVPCSPDWPDWMRDEAFLAALAQEEEPGDPDDEEDPGSAPPPGLDDAQLAVLPNGDVRWTMPSGRQYTTEPTRHPS